MYGSPARSERQKAEEDLEFLAKVRVAPYGLLVMMLKNHSGKNTPPWKVVVIERAIARMGKHEGR